MTNSPPLGRPAAVTNARIAAPARRRGVMRFVRALAPLLALAALEACGGGGSSGGSAPAPSFTLAGGVSHLDAAGLVITNGAETLAVPQGATSFAFTTPIPNTGSYNVTVAAQPAGENCVVANGAGTVVVANVSNVAIACNTAISSPLTVGVIPVGPSSVGLRILLPVGMVGDNSVGLNAVLDTGSAGTILNALDIFPSSMVSANGFVFPAGQTTLTYNGITVTNVTANRTYGAQGAIVTMDTGNIGFAQLKVGAGVSVTTKAVPILFVFQTSVNGQARASTSLSNLIGVNATAAPLAVPSNPVAAGTAVPFCSLATTTTCLVVSPLRNFTYSGTAAEGFVLNRVTLNACTSGPLNACPVQNALVLGLNSTVAAGFTTVPLDNCGTRTLPNGQSEQVCSQVVQGVTVASGGAAFTGPAIFDSGEPQVRLSVPQGGSFPTSPSPLPAGTRVGVSTSSGFSYQYAAGTGPYTTNVVQATSPSDFSNLALEFFTQNAFLLNYAAAAEGWKQAAPPPG